MGILVLTTTNTQSSAENIGEILVKNKLVACVNIVEKVTSIYEWKGEIVKDKEYLLLIKTKKELFKALEEKIKEIHPYQLPEIIAFDINQGSEEYLKWIDNIRK
jgi:periplasmic divalent cation tolerance protein